MTRSSLVVCVALCLAGVTGSAEAASDPEHLPLRLSDLAAGYQLGDDSGCAQDLGGEDAPRVLIELARNHSPRICDMEFERLWVEPGQPPGPGLIESTAAAFDDVVGAEAGFAAGRELLAFLTGVSRSSLEPRPVPAPVGDAVAVFRTDDALVRGRVSRPGVAVMWRTGALLSSVLLGLSTVRAFGRYKRARLGRLVRLQRCGSFERVDVPLGRGVVRARYTRPPRRCGRRTPDRYFGVLRVGDAVVTVNVPFCLMCVPRPGDPYNAPAGVRALLQALQPRP